MFISKYFYSKEMFITHFKNDEKYLKKKMHVHFTTVEKAIKTFMYEEEKLPFEGARINTAK